MTLDTDSDIERGAIQGELNGHRRPPKRPAAPTSPPPDPEDEKDRRPVIKMVTGELHHAIEKGVRALKADKDIYQREGVLVHVTEATRLDEEESEGEFLEGTPRIHDMSTDTLRARLTRYARWVRFDGRKDDWRAAEPTDHIVRAVATKKEWPGLRRLTGVIESPSLRPDGSVISRPGYDAQTGFLYAPRCEYPAIKDRPTLDDARRALAELEDVFIDFPYASDACRSMAVAAALTILARPAIKGATPAHVFDANTPGSGKTLQADSAAIIATGRESGRKDFPTDKRNANDEVNKVLCAYAMIGARMINFDNLSSEVVFGGSALEMVVTAEHHAEFRLLGASKIISLPWRTVILGSGNNVVISRDMLRRTMVSRIESPWPQPELRPLTDFKHPERAFALKIWIRENRVRLVAAALTLLRAHAVAGRPSPSRTWASFEAWTKVIADALVWAGGADPLECRPTEEGDHNPEKLAVGVVLQNWSRLDPTGKGITLKGALGALYPPERLRGEHLPPDGFEDLREALEQLAPPKPRQAPDPGALGFVFRRYKRSVVGALCFDTTKGHNNVQKWLVIHRGQAPTPAQQDLSLGSPTDV